VDMVWMTEKFLRVDYALGSGQEFCNMNADARSVCGS